MAHSEVERGIVLKGHFVRIEMDASGAAETARLACPPAA